MNYNYNYEINWQKLFKLAKNILNYIYYIITCLVIDMMSIIEY